MSGSGFHHMLADFLGWGGPMLARDEGTEVPLYLEMVFPLYVEQKRGWGAIQATMPSYGVPNAASSRSSSSFLASVSIGERASATTS